MDRAAEFAAKAERTTAFLAENGLNGVVLSRGENFAWAGCGANNLVNEAAECGPATLVLRGEDATLVTNNIEAGRLTAEELDGVPLASTETYPWHRPADRVALIERLTAGGRFAADDGIAGLPPLPDGFRRLRFRLTDAEVARCRALGADATEAVEDAARAVEQGMTEAEAAALLALECRMRAILPAVLLVANEERLRAWRHPLPKDVAIERQALLVLTGRRRGLHVALTRLIHFGEPSDDLAARHRAVCAVDAAFIAATRPGRTAAEVFTEGQRAYAAGGFPDEWQLHHQGGAIGYRGREWVADPVRAETVQSRQTFAWNPSIRGTKSEDTILAGEGEPEFITSPGPAWPTLTAERDGLTLRRADILTR